MSRSKSNSRSPIKRSSQTNKVFDEEELDEILENINLKRPRSMYTHFCLEEIEKFKNKNKNKKIDLKTFSKECAKKWNELSDKEKKKYIDKFEEDKMKYKHDLEIVRHYLFKDYNDVVRRPPTAYRIYLNEKLREGFEKDLDPKKVKAKASKDWRMMSEEDRNTYKDRKKDNDDWFEKAKTTRKVTALSIFVQNTIKTAKEKNKEVPTLADIAPLWKKMSKSEKQKYIDYANDINEEREKLQDIYELVSGVKPKKPAGAFRVFLQEKAKEKALHSLKEGKELWDQLSKEEKDEYLKKAHRCKLAYKYKKMIYNKKIKKILPKRPANAYAQFLKEKKGQKIPKGEKAVVYWREEYENLSKDKKKKYEQKAELEREKYQKKMKEFDNYVFDMPKRPLNAFTLFVKDRIPDLKEDRKNKGLTNQELLKIAAKEWNNEDGVSQSKYEKKAEQDKKRFIRQLKDFETMGYYKRNSRGERTKKEDVDEGEDEDEDEEEEKSKRKMRKKRSSSNASKSTRKGSKRAKSKSKSQDTKRKRSSSKGKKRMGKTQKKK